MFNMRRAGELMLLQSDLFPVTLKHAFATKRLSQHQPPGSKKNCPNFRLDSIDQTYPWWLKLRDRVFTPRHTCFAQTQVHGGTIRIIDPDNPVGEELETGGFMYRLLGEGDGIIKPFSRKPAFLAITTADCLPVIAYDPNTGASGVFHAGWRGLAADIPGNAIRAFKSELGIEPKDLLWAIGPSIDVDNYEVGNEVIAALETAGYAETDWQTGGYSEPGWVRGNRRDHFKVNLRELCRFRLRSFGVPDSQIDVCILSTFGNPNLFYSYRRDGGVTGLQAAVIG